MQFDTFAYMDCNYKSGKGKL